MTDGTRSGQVIDATDARQGRLAGRVRRILVVSMVFAVVVLTALLVYVA